MEEEAVAVRRVVEEVQRVAVQREAVAVSQTHWHSTKAREAREQPIVSRRMASGCKKADLQRAAPSTGHPAPHHLQGHRLASSTSLRQPEV